jgi:hypothetical protein
MRKYASVSPMFWLRGTGKQLRGHKEAQLVALYLMTSPAANMVGIFPLSLATLCHETGLTEEEARKGLQRCSEGASKGLRRGFEGAFASYDEDEEIVFVHALVVHQVGDQLKLGSNGRPDKKSLGIKRELAPF